MLWCDAPAPRVHNLAALLDLCRVYDPTFSRLEPVAELTPYAVEVRYGDEPIWPSRDELAEALAIAEEAAGVVSALLRERGFEAVPPELEAP